MQRDPGRMLSVARLAGLLLLAVAAARADTPRALIVGGGPTPNHNQVAIESNVRYVTRLLPKGCVSTVLFADGDAAKETVLFEQKAKPLSQAETVLAMLVEGRDAAHPADLRYRAPGISRIDGASTRTSVQSALARLGEQRATSTPVLLYFTGHGSPNKTHDLNNNSYDLWGDDGLSVKELSSALEKFPAEQALTLVMVQCYSGAFGNLLFEGGDPQRPPIERDIAGFFATVKERMAAGCTPAVDESEYHDFTSYFFAALTGRDRVGRVVRGADYNGDGRVTMDEAFCYTLIHDTSIDIPVCTSDVLLRSLLDTPDAEIFKAPYGSVKQWATTAQRAALDQISAALKLSGDDRGQTGFSRFRGEGRPEQDGNPEAAARRKFSQLRREERQFLLERWPALAQPESPGYAAVHREALAYVERQAKAGKYDDLLAADRGFDAAEDQAYKSEIADALLTRFVRLFKTVVLTHAVRTGTDAAAKVRLERLLAAESRPLFAPVTSVAMRRDAPH